MIQISSGYCCPSLFHGHAGSSTSPMQMVEGLFTPSMVTFFFSTFLYCNLFHTCLQQPIWFFSRGGLSETLLSNQRCVEIYVWYTLLYVLYMFLQFYLVVQLLFSPLKRVLYSIYYRCYCIRAGAIPQVLSQFLVLDMLPSELISTLESYPQ